MVPAHCRFTTSRYIVLQHNYTVTWYVKNTHIPCFFVHFLVHYTGTLHCLHFLVQYHVSWYVCRQSDYSSLAR